MRASPVDVRILLCVNIICIKGVDNKNGGAIMCYTTRINSKKGGGKVIYSCCEQFVNSKHIKGNKKKKKG